MESVKFCENCGKEHNGSYGSGRFCSYHCKQKFGSVKAAAVSAKLRKAQAGIKCQCEYCGKKFESKLDLKKHLRVCDKKSFRGKKSKEGGWNCSCGENFRTRSLLEAHKKTCKVHYVETNGTIRRIAHIKYVDYTCQFCNESFVHKPINSKTLHEKQCLANPNRVPNKNFGSHLSEEQKQKMSETMKKKIAEGSFVVPYKRNHSSKVSYPEQYFMEVFKELPGIKYNYQVGLYQLDFAWPEKKIYVEIDGEQHYADKKIIEHDKIRTEKLNDLGWTCLKRVRWSDFKKLKDEQKIIYCKELISSLNEK